MQVQVNTDDNVEGRVELIRRVESEIQETLGRFSAHITRIEVHLSDEDADKTSSDDKRCSMEVRLAGRQPEAVSHRADSLEQAFKGAARKLRRSLDSTLGRLTQHKGAASIRRDVRS
jgi:ribosome-associated translation inhibitor RaiA